MALSWLISSKVGTSKMLKRFWRHLKEGGSSLVRNVALSSSSAAAVMLTLLLVSLFLVLTANLYSISENISENLLIHVKIDNAVVSDTAINDLKNEISQIANVKQILFSSRDSELEKQLAAFPSLAGILKIRDENPLRNAFIVYIRDKEQIQVTAQAISALSGVEQTEFGGQGVSQLINILGSIQKGSFVLVVALGLLAIFLISNTIKVTIYSRKEEISLMRTIGASNGFIRAPFVIEGIYIGIIGSIIPIILSVGLYYVFYTKFDGQFFSAIFKLMPLSPFLYYLVGLLLLTGMMVGLIGSYVSVTRYLRWRR